MKHIPTITKLIGGSLLVLALLVGASAARAQTSSTTDMTGTASSTAPVITSESAASSADGMSETVSWLTDVNSTSQVAYGSTSAYSASTTLDTNSTTDHTVVISGLVPSSTYHFQVISSDISGDMATSADQVFVTATPSTSGTGSSTNITDLQNQVSALQSDINSLQARLNMIWAELSALLGNNGGATGGTGGTVTGTPSLTPASATVPADGNSVIDFNGRNFGHEETVNITLNGSQVGSAHADGGGNFSTGSMRIPSGAGTYTYAFTGATSGTSLTSTVTVQ